MVEQFCKYNQKTKEWKAMPPIPPPGRLGRKYVSLGRYLGKPDKVPLTAILALEVYFHMVSKCGTPPYHTNNKWNGNENPLEALDIANNIRIETLEAEIIRLKIKLADPAYEFDDENIDEAAARHKLYTIGFGHDRQ